MAKFIRYFKQNAVDLIILMITISIAIKSKDNTLAFSMCGFFSMYVFATIIRMGSSIDLFDEYIYDKNVRSDLGLGPYPGSNNKQKSTLFYKIVQIIFWLALISILGYFILS